MPPRDDDGFGPLGSPERSGSSMRASSKLPAQDRPTYYRAPGLQAAREAAGMSIAEVAQACGYGASIVAAMEAGEKFHSMSISRVASVIPGHDLSQIRDES